MKQRDRCIPWTPDEKATLRRLAAAGHLDHEIAKRLGRPRAAVQGMRRRLGITAGMSPGLKGVMRRLQARQWWL